MSAQTKQTNLYLCGSEEVALTLAKKFLIDKTHDLTTTLRLQQATIVYLNFLKLKFNSSPFVHVRYYKDI